MLEPELIAPYSGFGPAKSPVAPDASSTEPVKEAMYATGPVTFPSVFKAPFSKITAFKETERRLVAEVSPENNISCPTVRLASVPLLATRSANSGTAGARSPFTALRPLVTPEHDRSRVIGEATVTPVPALVPGTSTATRPEYTIPAAPLTS